MDSTLPYLGGHFINRPIRVLVSLHSSTNKELRVKLWHRHPIRNESYLVVPDWVNSIPYPGSAAAVTGVPGCLLLWTWVQLPSLLMCVVSSKFRDVSSSSYNQTTASQVDIYLSQVKLNMVLSSDETATSYIVGKYTKSCLYSLKIDGVPRA